MRLLLRIGFLATVMCLTQTELRAAEPTVGEAPPEIKIDEWLSAKPEMAGKPVLLEFWATWCPPCRKSIPHLNELEGKYKDKGLVIVGVSDEDAAAVKEFQKGTPMNYPNGLSKDLVQKYGVNGIPHAFLIGKDGKLLWRGHPMQLTDADIEKALK
jgi:thiol-disulfide isomerase/thioredoxin